MVGRLIEQQHVRASQQQFGQLDTHAPAAAELFSGSVKVATFKSQAHQGLLNLGLDVFALHQGPQFGLLGHSLDQFLVLFTVIVSALGQFLVHSVDGGIHLLQVLKSSPRFLFDGKLILELHLLRQIADGDVGLA